MEVLPLIVSTSWASGINGYAVVLLLGLAGRLYGFENVPATLQQTDVLGMALLLATVNLAADKLPYIDSAWDALHTLIRPVIGAWLGGVLMGATMDRGAVIGSLIGGSLALISHLIKSGLRVVVNTSPEPLSTFVVSAFEDLTVAVLVTLALLHPWVSLTVVTLLAVAGIFAVTVLWRRIRAARRRRPSRRPRPSLASRPRRP